MAYDFGGQSLGITNPFKTEGKIRLISGIIIAALAFIPLFSIADTLKIDPVKAWGQAILGLILLIWGFKNIATSTAQLFRFYVGRSVPSSLAYNLTPSEQDNARSEQQMGSLRYNAKELESMLMGRKNTTFYEPIGWFSRLIHSLFPKLYFAPYPLRNFIQEIASLCALTLIAMVAFGISSFVVATGLAGDAGVIITPILSFLLLIYLSFLWRKSAKNTQAKSNITLQKKSIANLSLLIVFSITIPIVIGFGYNSLLSSQLNDHELAEINHIISSLFPFNAWLSLGILFVFVLLLIIPIALMTNERLKKVVGKTSVSEYRANMQESVHPNEIFINIENIVLANRRYKEIPNRIYRNLEPELQTQSNDKGVFHGQLLIETQPEYKEMNLSPLFKQLRFISTLFAQLFVIAGALFLLWLFDKGFDLREGVKTFIIQEWSIENASALGALLTNFLTLFFIWIGIQFSGQILTRFCHLTWAEIQFESLLMWMKTEGTYTESKISTGMAYNDSTRSENTVVRSSITPWLLTSRILTSTYATSGMMNLEHLRLILEMKDNPEELNEIVNEIHSFLRGREYIASIDNEKDLANAERIYQVNKITRSNDAEMSIKNLDHNNSEDDMGILSHTAAENNQANTESESNLS